MQLLAEHRQHRIRRELKRISLIVHRQKIAYPSRDRERNRDERLRAPVPLYIGLDVLSEPDCRHLGNVHRNPLRGVAKVRIREALGHQLIEKCLRREDTRILNDRKSLDIADPPGELPEVGIAHAVCEEIVAQQ